jgi:transposase
MIRMLIVGYVFAIRSERALCREVQVNLAYRWFEAMGGKADLDRRNKSRWGRQRLMVCCAPRGGGSSAAACRI